MDENSLKDSRLLNLKNISIGSRLVGENKPVYVIAEIGSNHNQDKSLALEMIDRASDAGADAVKFQSIRFDALYSSKIESDDFKSWFSQIELNESWYHELSAAAQTRQIDFLSAPTYLAAIDLLEQLNVPAYKIASPQAQGHLDIVKKAAGTGKPLIISMGYCRYQDITRVIEVCLNAGNEQIIPLHCISKYPTEPRETNLRFLTTLSEMTGYSCGFSDHSLGITLPLAAVAMGACVIEKHVTTDRSLSGPDHHFALTFEEFGKMTTGIRDVEIALGSGERDVLLPEEEELREWVRLKAFACRDISAGEKLSVNDVKYLRSTIDGIPRDEKDRIFNSVAKTDIQSGALLQWTNLEEIV